MLTDQQRQDFIERGYFRLDNAFDPAVGQVVLDHLWSLTGIDPDDRTTWPDKAGILSHYSEYTDLPVDGLYSQKGRTALRELVGTEDWKAVKGPGMVLGRLPGYDTPPWGPLTVGHIDGNHFHHHLDSPEQGLIVLFVFTDMVPEGGGTWLIEGSHRHTAHILADAQPHGLALSELTPAVRKATEHLPPVEVIGNAGDMLVMHPLVYHGSSKNLSDRVRVVSNIAIALEEPMQFDRPDDELSLVERATAEALRTTPT